MEYINQNNSLDIKQLHGYTVFIVQCSSFCLSLVKFYTPAKYEILTEKALSNDSKVEIPSSIFVLTSLQMLINVLLQETIQ